MAAAWIDARAWIVSCHLGDDHVRMWQSRTHDMEEYTSLAATPAARQVCASAGGGSPDWNHEVQARPGGSSAAAGEAEARAALPCKPLAQHAGGIALHSSRAIILSLSSPPSCSVLDSTCPVPLYGHFKALVWQSMRLEVAIRSLRALRCLEHDYRVATPHILVNFR